MAVLWSDVLWYVLLVLAAYTIVKAKKNVYWSQVWRRVNHQAVAMVSLTLLAFFVLITLLDSVHFKINHQLTSQHGKIVFSIFDRLMEHVILADELSYSKPLATHLSVPYHADGLGLRAQHYPHLQSVPKHLVSGDKAYYLDVWYLAFKGVLMGVLCWCLLVTGGLALLAKGHVRSWLHMIKVLLYQETWVAWRPVVLALLMILVTLSVVIQLGHHYHVLGTDKIGRDVLFMALKSVRTGVLIGTLTSLLMLPFAVLFGLYAGYLGGWVDDVIQYIYTTISAVPSILLISAMVLVLQVYIHRHPVQFPTIVSQADAKLLMLCAVLGLTSWTQLCRLLRAEALKLRELDYVHCAVTLGVKTHRIILRHLLPNVMPIILINVILDFSGLVLAEAILSYIGVGVDPSLHSWGNMIHSTRMELARDPMVWWPMVTVMGMMLALVLPANLLADAVREALDPHAHQLQMETP
jgi:peptide/nickel transport system permease protein